MQESVAPAPALLLFTHARASFDGNVTSMLTNWMFPMPQWEGLTESAIERLMEVTVDEDNVAWMILVTNGYRV